MTFSPTCRRRRRSLLAGGSGLALDVLDGGLAVGRVSFWAPCSSLNRHVSLFSGANAIRRAKSLHASAAMLNNWCGRSSKACKGEHQPRFSDLLVPGTRRIASVVWIGMGLAAFQQFVGINIIFYYGEVLWKAAGATEQWALHINLLTGFINILATIPAIMLIDRVGRKPFLLAGSVGMALTLGAMARRFCRGRGRPRTASPAHPSGRDLRIWWRPTFMSSRLVSPGGR